MNELARRKLYEKGMYAEKDPYSKIGGYRVRNKRNGEIIKENLTLTSLYKYAMYGDEGLKERKPHVSNKSIADNNAVVMGNYYSDPANRPKTYHRKPEINSKKEPEKVYDSFEDIFEGETPKKTNQETNQEINSAKTPSINDGIIAMLEAEEAYLRGEKKQTDDFDDFDVFK